MFFMDKAYYFSRCHGIGVSYWISAFSSSLHFFPRPPGLWRTLCRWICLSILSVQSIKGQTTQGQAKQGRSLPLRAGPHRVRLHRAFYTKHQGWTRKHQASRAFYTNHQSNKSSKHKIIKASSVRGLLCKASRMDPQADTLCIKASRAFYTIHQSIKSSKHQTLRVFYTKPQGWTRKLTPCAFRFSDLKVNIFRS